jgi:hypothetical protein
MYADKNRISQVRKSLLNSIVTMNAATSIDEAEPFPSNRLAVRFVDLAPRFQNTIAAVFATDKNKNKKLTRYRVNKQEANRLLSSRQSNKFNLNNGNAYGLQSSLLNEKDLRNLQNENNNNNNNRQHNNGIGKK